MAILKFKNPNYTSEGTEPKYISIPNIFNPIEEVFIGDTQPEGTGKLWIDTTDSSIKYNNSGEWIIISSEIDLSDYALKSEVEKKADRIKVEDGGTGAIAKELQPNVLYKFGEVSSLTVTLAAEVGGEYNEYMFEFVSGETPTTLSLPETIKWSGGEAPTIEVSKTYQISIVNNLALIASF